MECPHNFYAVHWDHEPFRAPGQGTQPTICRPGALAALFHFDEHDGLPDVIGKAGAATVLCGLTDAKSGGTAHVQAAGQTESLEKTVEEYLGLAFLVTRDVPLRPGKKLPKFFLA